MHKFIQFVEAHDGLNEIFGFGKKELPAMATPPNYVKLVGELKQTAGITNVNRISMNNRAVAIGGNSNKNFKFNVFLGIDVPKVMAMTFIGKNYSTEIHVSSNENLENWVQIEIKNKNITQGEYNTGMINIWFPKEFIHDAAALSKKGEHITGY